MTKATGDNIIQGPWDLCFYQSSTFRPAHLARDRAILVDQLAVTLALARAANDSLPVKVSFLVTCLGMDHSRILCALAHLLQTSVIDRDMIDFDCTGLLSDTREGRC